MSFLFGIQGRFNRAKWWLASVIYIVVFAALVTMFVGAFFRLARADLLAIIGTFGGLGIVLAIIVIVVLISSVAVGVKRLHDRGKSGWWLLLFYLAPALLNQAALAMPLQYESNAAFSLRIVSLAIAVWAFVELGCLRGTIGGNRFGPDPLAGRGVV